MRKVAPLFTLMAVGAFVCAAAARADQPPRGDRATTNADQKFIEEAACGGRAEVQLGKLAVQRAENPAVRDFGQRMVRDHSMANKELLGIASQKGVTLPREMDKKTQDMIDKLSQLQGAEFDRAYMKHMVKDHKHDLSAFKKEAKEGRDPMVKEFASKTLPTLEEHLKLAEDTERMVNGQGGQRNR